MIDFPVGIPIYLVILVNLVDLVILVNMGKSVDFFNMVILVIRMNLMISLNIAKTVSLVWCLWWF